MAPALLPGDRLLAVRLRRTPSVGEIVLAPDPRATGRELVKRVAAVGAGAVTLAGDNPAESTDARTFGALPPEAVAWRIVLRYWPPRRFGRPGRPAGASRAAQAPRSSATRATQAAASDGSSATPGPASAPTRTSVPGAGRTPRRASGQR